MKNRTILTMDDIEKLVAKGLIRGYVDNGESKKEKKSKYNNKKVVIDNITFDSKKESRRYVELRMQERAGEIKDLKYHVLFNLEVDGKKVAGYVADFTYTIVATGEYVVEDVKSKHTRTLPVYRLKKKLMAACHGIIIKEV